MYDPMKCPEKYLALTIACSRLSDRREFRRERVGKTGNCRARMGAGRGKGKRKEERACNHFFYAYDPLPLTFGSCEIISLSQFLGLHYLARSLEQATLTTAPTLFTPDFSHPGSPPRGPTQELWSLNISRGLQIFEGLYYRHGPIERDGREKTTEPWELNFKSLFLIFETIST